MIGIVVLPVARQQLLSDGFPEIPRKAALTVGCRVLGLDRGNASNPMVVSHLAPRCGAAQL
jgi:hypothetical protein